MLTIKKTKRGRALQEFVMWEGTFKKTAYFTYFWKQQGL